MDRLLISQNETNNSQDYIIVDGELITDQDLCLNYYRKLKETDNWKQDFKDDFLELKSNNKNILLKSHYIEKDNVNRSIYYMYLVKKNDDLNVILEFLEKDSQNINRSIDKEKTLDIISKIKTNKKLKSVFYKLIYIIIAISIVYGIIKNIKQ